MSLKIKSWLIILSLFLGLTSVYVYIAVPQITKEQSNTFSQVNCTVTESQGNKRFSIYIPTDWNAQPLANIFCDTLLKTSDYRDVVVSWKPREQLSADELLAQEFDLVMSRHRELNGLVPDYSTLYHELLSYPQYPIYLYAQMTLDSVTQSLFYKRTVGLLRDKKSQSGHLIPLLALKQRQIALPAEQLRWFDNREQMIRAFSNREVDFIPALGIETGLANWPTTQRALLKTMPSLGSWFLATTVESSIGCVIQRYFVSQETRGLFASSAIDGGEPC
ncbi:hypothetical protein [Vibrio methylphosphonaticus]|uniref:hypothetical protein n=1 Tax=Vibrio methylphosphonaticus TaxID=2946866 RepID=UPI00202A18B2|nr:hypothetical protein [Vibrio methylphosphonaticus]MCL9777485.1 hypothetical protein [Vibrio methylphosphonaticus]